MTVLAALVARVRRAGRAAGGAGGVAAAGEQGGPGGLLLDFAAPPSPAPGTPPVDRREQSRRRPISSSSADRSVAASSDRCPHILACQRDSGYEPKLRQDRLPGEERQRFKTLMSPLVQLRVDVDDLLADVKRRDVGGR